MKYVRFQSFVLNGIEWNLVVVLSFTSINVHHIGNMEDLSPKRKRKQPVSTSTQESPSVSFWQNLPSKIVDEVCFTTGLIDI